MTTPDPAHTARGALLAFADRLAGEDIPTQDGCVAFARDVAEEYPGGEYAPQIERAELGLDAAAHVTHGQDDQGVRWCALQAALTVRLPEDEPRDILGYAQTFEDYLRGTL